MSEQPPHFTESQIPEQEVPPQMFTLETLQEIHNLSMELGSLFTSRERLKLNIAKMESSLNGGLLESDLDLKIKFRANLDYYNEELQINIEKIDELKKHIHDLAPELNLGQFEIITS